MIKFCRGPTDDTIVPLKPSSVVTDSVSWNVPLTLIRNISKTSIPSSIVATTLSTFAVAPDADPVMFLPPKSYRLPLKGADSLRDVS